jgi:hypothetical protein
MSADNDFAPIFRVLESVQMAMTNDQLPAECRTRLIVQAVAAHDALGRLCRQADFLLDVNLDLLAACKATRQFIISNAPAMTGMPHLNNANQLCFDAIAKAEKGGDQ